MSLIYVVGEDYNVETLFKEFGHEVFVLKNPLAIAEKLDKPDLVVFTGGSDVWPALYGEKNTASACNPRRDIEETIWFHRFFNARKVGICRGGQFLNVMCGGKMVQDIPGHAIPGLHWVYDDYDVRQREFEVTSTHHQAMVKGALGNLLSVSRDNIQEVIFYPKNLSLCFQPHPEYGPNTPNENPTLFYFSRLLIRTFNIDFFGVDV